MLLCVARMRKPDDEITPRRFRRLPHGGPLRVLAPWVCMVVGAMMVIKGVIDVQARGDALYAFLGAGLVVVGAVTFFVNRWQEKRGT